MPVGTRGQGRLWLTRLAILIRLIVGVGLVTAGVAAPFVLMRLYDAACSVLETGGDGNPIAMAILGTLVGLTFSIGGFRLLLGIPIGGAGPRSLWLVHTALGWLGVIVALAWLVVGILGMAESAVWAVLALVSWLVLDRQLSTLRRIRIARAGFETSAKSALSEPPGGAQPGTTPAP